MLSNSNRLGFLSATIPIRCLRTLWGVLNDLGRSELRDLLFNKFNLTKKRLSSEERIAVPAVMAILEFCEKQGISEAGFITGMASQYGQFGIFDYYLASNHTLGEMIISLERYLPVLVTGNSRVQIQFSNKEPLIVNLPYLDEKNAAGEKLFNEMLLGIIIRTVRVNSGIAKIWPTEVSFPYSNIPKTIVDYLTKEGVNITLKKKEYQLIYPEGILSNELQYRDVLVIETLKPTLETLLLKTQSEQSISAKALEVLNKAPDLLRVSLSGVSEELGLSQSSLKRKLQEEGTSFSYLLARFKQSYSMDLVTKSDKKITNIAIKLGYTNRTAFERAFKEWFGATPSQIRLELLTSKLPNKMLDLIEVDSLPSSPAIYQEIIAMMASDKQTIKNIAGLIESEPALTGKLIGIANSAYYGYRKIGSISQAMTELFGIEQTRNFVLSVMSIEQFNVSQCKGMNLELFWLHAAATYEGIKSLADMLAFKDKTEKQGFTLAALLHRLFELVYASQHPKDMTNYFKLIKNEEIVMSHESCQVIEQLIFGMRGYQTTALLLAHWSVPSDIHRTIRDMSNESGSRSKNAVALALVSDYFRFVIYNKCEENDKEEILIQLSELLNTDYEIIQQHIQRVEACQNKIREQASNMF